MQNFIGRITNSMFELRNVAACGVYTLSYIFKRFALLFPEQFELFSNWLNLHGNYIKIDQH